MKLNTNDATIGRTLISVLQTLAKEICSPLTDCTNSARLTGTFPNELKLRNVIPIHKKVTRMLE